jgi:hypothetical protein
MVAILAKTFGELYFLLEYRDQRIGLQYSQTDFTLPTNLYFIGTMNTADRSTARLTQGRYGTLCRRRPRCWTKGRRAVADERVFGASSSQVPS